jgi:hypothetical protein
MASYSSEVFDAGNVTDDVYAIARVDMKEKGGHAARPTYRHRRRHRGGDEIAALARRRRALRGADQIAL